MPAVTRLENVSIESDGTTAGSIVKDKSGKEIPVTRVVWELDASTGISTCTLYVVGSSLKAYAEEALIVVADVEGLYERPRR